MRTDLGCHAVELEVGDEFSFDEGFSWVAVVTIVEDPRPDCDDVIINYRDDAGTVDTLRCDSRRHVLLDRHWKV